jgi:hypothetical protein
MKYITGKIWILLLAIFIIMVVLGINEYPAIEVIVRIICTSCIGLGS